MVKISLCCITKNEERRIARCISSIKDAVDEIIIVDTGSGDNTIKIALGLGAAVYEFEWRDDFAAARNFALRHAKGDWIIFLDADEYFPEGSAARVRDTIEKAHATADCYGIMPIMRNFISQDETEYSDAPIMRIFRNHPSIRYHGRIHEAVGRDTGKSFNEIRPDPDDFYILHDGYIRSLNPAKAQRNIAMLQAELDGGIEDPRLLYYIGREYYQLGDDERALDYFRRLLDTGFRDRYFTIAHFIAHAQLLERLGYPVENRIEVLNKGVAQYPNHPTLYLLRGYEYSRIGDEPQALRDLSKGFELQGGGFSDPYTPNHMAKHQSMFRGVAASLYLRKDEPERAFEHACISFELDKNQTAALEIVARLAERFPQQTLQFLSRVFDLGDAKALSELLTLFARNQPGTVYLSLFEKYYALKQAMDIHMFTMMAVVGEYTGAIDGFLGRFAASGEEPYLAKALAVAIISGDRKHIQSVSKCGDNSYSQIAGAYLSEGKLPAGCDRAYLAVAGQAAALAGQSPNVRRFIDFFGASGSGDASSI